MNVNWGANIGNVCTDVKGKLTFCHRDIFRNSRYHRQSSSLSVRIRQGNVARLSKSRPINVLWIRNSRRTLLHMRWADALTKWQHFFARNDVMAAILKV